jgi:5-methylcytosine-specific restriction endonuclease McrA
LRDLKLKTNPICQVCDSALALEVHHIQPVSKAPDREMDWENLQSICPDCHKAESAAEQLRGTGAGDSPQLA